MTKVLKFIPVAALALGTLSMPVDAAHGGGGGGGGHGGFGGGFGGGGRAFGGGAGSFGGARMGGSNFAAPRAGSAFGPARGGFGTAGSRGYVAGPYFRPAPVGERVGSDRRWGNQGNWHGDWHHHHDDHHHHDNHNNVVFIGGLGYWDGGYYYGYNDWPYYYDNFYDYGYNNAPAATVVIAPPAVAESTAVEVQRELKRRGYYRGVIDGIVGRQTRAAIRAYQSRRGLAVNGQINRSLLRSLRIA